MPDIDLNFLAVLVAALAYYALGALWYGVLLSKQWMKAVGRTPEDLAAEMAEGGSGLTYPLQGLATLGLVFFAAVWIVNVANANTAAEGVVAALWLAPVGVLACSGDFLYEGRSLPLFVLNSGYRILGLVVAGAILGGWQ